MKRYVSYSVILSALLFSNSAFAGDPLEVLSIDKCILEISEDRNVDLSKDIAVKKISYLNLRTVNVFNIREKSEGLIKRGQKKYEVNISAARIETNSIEEVRRLKNAVISCINK